MSAVKTASNPTLELASALRQATALGCEFRISGADITVSNIDRLPEPIRSVIERRQRDGFLYDYLGATDDDDEAIAFLEKLGVKPIPTETREEMITAITFLTEQDAPVGFDIETAPLPQYALPRPAIEITKDGALSGSPRKKHDDPAGTDPHRAAIMVASLYAGGSKVFVFRGEALHLLLQSKWLRQQLLVAHNAGFEIKFLRHHTQPVDGVKPRPVECTMQAAGLLIGVGHQGERRGLAKASVAMLRTPEPPKALQTSDWAASRLSRGQIAYAASDAILAWRLWHTACFELEEQGRTEAYKLQRDVIPVVSATELAGLGFDKVEHAHQLDQWSRELAEARHAFLAETGRPPPSTESEVRDWIKRVADPERLARWPRTKTGLLSASQEALKWLALSDVPTIKPVLSILAMQTLIRNFGEKLVGYVSPATGRIHAGYNIAATKPGRFSCMGPNMQQLPSHTAPEFRKCIVAAPGHVLICCDWNQVEMRALAVIARDPILTAIYAADPPGDIHRETASRISGVPASQVTDAQRKLAKAINFGVIFGMGAAKFVAYAFSSFGIEMTEAEAKGDLARFWAAYPGLRNWRRVCGEQCDRQLTIRIGAGRVMKPEWEPGGELKFTQYCNFPVQGICADAMLRALRIVSARLRGLHASIVATVHDELLVEAHEDDADKARAVLEGGMVDAFRATFPGASYHGVATAGIGADWFEAKADADRRGKG